MCIKKLEEKRIKLCLNIENSIKYGLGWKWVSHSVVSDSANFLGQNTGVGSLSHLQANPGIEPHSPALQVDSLPAEPQGKPKNTGVGSLSLLQQIFPTQESDQDFLHCRWFLYQLSYREAFLGWKTTGKSRWWTDGLFIILACQHFL